MFVHWARIEKRYLTWCTIIHRGCCVRVHHSSLVTSRSLESDLKIVATLIGTCLPWVTINASITRALFIWHLSRHWCSLRYLVLRPRTIILLLAPIIIVKPIRALIEIGLLQIIACVSFFFIILLMWLSLHIPRNGSLRGVSFAKLLAHLWLTLWTLLVELLLIHLRFIHLYYNETVL